MYQACIEQFQSVDAAILSAAVADYTVSNPSGTKLKREKGDLLLELHPTKDIAAQLGNLKREDQILVGFALETNNELQNAQKKLQNKNLDFIILNSLNDKGAGFQVDRSRRLLFGTRRSKLHRRQPNFHLYSNRRSYKENLCLAYYQYRLRNGGSYSAPHYELYRVN